MAQWSKPFDMQIDPAKSYSARLETSHGTIELDLHVGDAPNTVNNFVSLARQGFYDGTPFHRILKGFVVQGGDPTGTGSGGPGYSFADEPITKNYERGTVAMANAGPNTNGSQFFICLADLSGSLPKNYTIFGSVTAGLDTVDAMANVTVKRGASREMSTPTEPVTLNTVTITEG